MIKEMFESMDWKDDRMSLAGLTFRLEHTRSDKWNGGDHFRFYKIKPLVDQYATFFSRHRNFQPECVLEIGIYDGGGTAFWFEILNPRKLLAIDMVNRDDSDTFKRWISDRSLDKRVGTYWRTDQADKARLRQLVVREMGGHLDLVIDDGSHLYAPTKASFEALFPLCRPGSFYIIEDWAWDHWPEYSKPDHPWKKESRLTQLVIELVEATGSAEGLIASIDVFPGFVAVQRGGLEFSPGHDFKLDQHIVRRPSVVPPAKSHSAISRLRRFRNRLGKWASRTSVLPK
jgi:hypothetical protein